MRTPHVLMLLAALAASSYGVRQWMRDTDSAANDATHKLRAPSMGNVSTRAIAPTRSDINEVAESVITKPDPATPSTPNEKGLANVNAGVSATAEAPSSNDSVGTPDAPGDPDAQPENPSEQFMHSRRGDGQHPE